MVGYGSGAKRLVVTLIRLPPGKPESLYFIKGILSNLVYVAMTNLIKNTVFFPQELVSLINGYTIEPVKIGASGASVYILPAAAKPNLYLKIALKETKVTFHPEVERLRWLKGRLSVPEVIFYRQDEAGEYLLLSEIAGKMSCDPAFEAEPFQVVKALAAGLKMLHSLEIKDCLFDARLKTTLEAARQRMKAGLVDETDFDEKRQGRTAAGLYAELIKTRPARENFVFTHGDYCLPNIILNPAGGKVSGFVDPGRCGVADRYQDLALAARSLAYNWGEKFVPALFKEYGLKEQEIDRGKIEFYQLLDEFF